MAYSYKNSKGETYFLHQRSTGKTGKGKLFYFSKQEKDEAIDTLPTGYKVKENERTGMPLVSKLV
jgi:hypothetical protein